MRDLRFLRKTGMDAIDKIRLQLAATYRKEVEVLFLRVQNMMKAVDNKTDEEIALWATPQPVKVGSTAPSWIEGPLRASQDCMLALTRLNLVKYVSLEEQRKSA